MLKDTETIAAGFTLERMFRKGTSVRAAFDRALERQQAYVSYDVKAVSQYDSLDHVKNGNMLLATREEAKEWKMLNPNFKVTPLKKNIRFPVVLLYNKVKFGKNVDLTKDDLFNMINTSKKISFGAIYGASRSAIQQFLSYGQPPEQVADLKEQIRSKEEHPQIALLGKDFARRAIIVDGYEFVFAPINLAQSYYRFNSGDSIGFATVNGKRISDIGYELFQEITYIVHNGNNTKKVKAMRNALADKKVFRALARQFGYFAD
jgi:hypothetical protein